MNIYVKKTQCSVYNKHPPPPTLNSLIFQNLRIWETEDFKHLKIIRSRPDWFRVGPTQGYTEKVCLQNQKPPPPTATTKTGAHIPQAGLKPTKYLGKTLNF